MKNFLLSIFSQKKFRQKSILETIFSVKNFDSKKKKVQSRTKNPVDFREIFP